MRENEGLEKKILLFTGDILLLLVAIWLSVAIRLNSVNVVTYYTGATVFVVISYLLSFYIFDLYDLKFRVYHTDFLTRFFVALLVGTLLTGVIFYVSMHWKFGRGIVLLNAVFVTFFTLLWRAIFRQFLVAGRTKKRVLIVGAGASGRAMCHLLQVSDDYDIAGIVDDDPKVQGKDVAGYRVLGGSSVIRELADGKKIDVVIVAITNEKEKELISSLLAVKLRGIGVYDMQSVYERITGKLPVSHLREGWLAYADIHGIDNGIYKVRGKKLLSQVCAAGLFMVTLPLSLLAILIIKLDSKGPVFFRQKRVGLDGKVFEIIKFRSMVCDAEKNGAMWAVDEDSRITRVGRFLRKLRIDELPQLLNVIKGDMSLVGPRPERPEFVEELQKTIPFYFIRHVIKPGLTGWAQVNYKYGASKEDALEKLQYDLFYIKNMGFMLDIRVILKTIRVVLFGLGAR